MAGEWKGPALTSIISLARAGALTAAWMQFEKEGLASVTDDPLVLTVKGRLLKDRAARERDGERRTLYREAAKAYRASAALRPATYPLINAASLALLAREEEQARTLAQEVLDQIEAEPDAPETPYYRAATRAEALLLLGRDREAQNAMDEAMKLAPRAWEDHAVTLRQFALILVERGADATWLEPHRPPASLHFGGHMSFAPDQHRPLLLEEIGHAIAQDRIGFGFGALAAGADIIVAEALVAAGAELHVVVPGGIERFAERSVMPYGAQWRARFDALLAAAETVRPVRPLDTAPDEAMIAVADEIAMGAALMNARRLQSRSLQLLILPTGGAGDGASAAAQARWVRDGRLQKIVLAPREPTEPAEALRSATALPFRPLALLAVGLSDTEPAAVEATLRSIRSAVDMELALPALIGSVHAILPFASVAEAAQAAGRLQAEPSDRSWRLAAHYGAAALITDPFSGAHRPGGPVVPIVEAALASTLAGTFTATEDFASVLALDASEKTEIGLAGELTANDGGGPIGLYSISLGGRS